MYFSIYSIATSSPKTSPKLNQLKKIGSLKTTSTLTFFIIDVLNMYFEIDQGEYT